MSLQGRKMLISKKRGQIVQEDIFFYDQHLSRLPYRNFTEISSGLEPIRRELSIMWISKHFSTDFRYFHDGLQTIEHFGTYIDDLVNKLTHIRQNQFEEKRDLEDVRNVLKTSPGFNKMVRDENKFWILARIVSPVVRWDFYVFVFIAEKKLQKKNKNF